MVLSGIRPALGRTDRLKCGVGDYCLRMAEGTMMQVFTARGMPTIIKDQGENTPRHFEAESCGTLRTA